MVDRLLLQNMFVCLRIMLDKCSIGYRLLYYSVVSVPSLDLATYWKLKNSRISRAGQPQCKRPRDLAVLDEDPEFMSDKDKIDTLLTEQKRLRDQALTNYDNARAILNNQSESAQDNIMALEQRDVTPIEKVVVVNADFDIPDNIENDIFRTTDAAVYSDSDPIPVGQKPPSGLVYKVQVGAFRNALPQDHFKEFAPISGEKLSRKA